MSYMQVNGRTIEVRGDEVLVDGKVVSGGSGPERAEVDTDGHEECQVRVNDKVVYEAKDGSELKIIVRIKNPKRVRAKEFEVVVEGDVHGDLKAHGPVTVKGGVGRDASTHQAALTVGGDVAGDATCHQGSRVCKDVRGNASAHQGKVRVEGVLHGKVKHEGRGRMGIQSASVIRNVF